MWLRSTFFSLLLLAACEQDKSEACDCEDATYSVNALLSLSPEADDAAGKAAADPQQRVLATVWESSSIVGCGNGLATKVTPGKDLVSRRPVSVDAAGFTLRFSARSYPQFDTPGLALEVVLDENANGRCDDGEPTGRAPVERALRSRVHIELTRGACAVRR